MSIQRPITKKSKVTCKKPLNTLCEKRLQSSMFKWPSFYYFLEFNCKILNSYAIYRCKKMVKILNCYLNAKKVMALCLRVQFFLANAVYILQKYKHNNNKSMHGTLKKSKIREVAENSANTEGGKIQSPRTTATRFDLAEGSHQQ